MTIENLTAEEQAVIAAVRLYSAEIGFSASAIEHAIWAVRDDRLTGSTWGEDEEESGCACAIGQLYIGALLEAESDQQHEELRLRFQFAKYHMEDGIVGRYLIRHDVEPREALAEEGAPPDVIAQAERAKAVIEAAFEAARQDALDRMA